MRRPPLRWEADYRPLNQRSDRPLDGCSSGRYLVQNQRSQKDVVAMDSDFDVRGSAEQLLHSKGQCVGPEAAAQNVDQGLHCDQAP